MIFDARNRWTRREVRLMGRAHCGFEFALEEFEKIQTTDRAVFERQRRREEWWRRTAWIIRLASGEEDGSRNG